MKRQMKVVEVSIELLEQDGHSYFPIGEPIPWDIVVNTTAANIMMDNPALLVSLTKAIRGAIARSKSAYCL